ANVDAALCAAVGLGSGKLLLLRGSLANLDGDVLEAPVKRSSAVLALKFSPDGQFAAAGYANHIIDIFDVAAGNVLHSCALKGHAGPVSELDWHSDNRFLRSTSRAAEELLFWDLSIKGREAEELLFWDLSRKGGVRVENVSTLRDLSHLPDI
ncbi:hypothetical protein T484DRAFT_1813371, partial [Baffinella frigidus]